VLSPLKPLLCRHDFYWSERHGSDRCRRCGKRQAAEAVDVLTGEPLGVAVAARAVAATPLTLDALPEFTPAGGGFIDFEGAPTRLVARSPERIRPSAKVLKAQAQERRESLLDLLDRLAEGVRPTREEAIDAVLAVIEDAHSANPVLFGPDAAGHFARLHEARSAPRC
jgi:hypothetical protein